MNVKRTPRKTNKSKALPATLQPLLLRNNKYTKYINKIKQKKNCKFNQATKRKHHLPLFKNQATKKVN